MLTNVTSVSASSLAIAATSRFICKQKPGQLAKNVLATQTFPSSSARSNRLPLRSVKLKADNGRSGFAPTGVGSATVGLSSAACRMWRWNEYLWPLVVLAKSELFTLPLALSAFQGELQTEWNYLLAMTVLTLIPMTLVFAFLQKHITTGIAASGIK